MKRNIATIVLSVMMLSACHGYQVHPGSINTFDSQTADALLQAKTLLDNSKASLTPKTTPLWTALAKAYDAAYPSYEAWRAVASKNLDATKQAEELRLKLIDVANAINAYKKGPVQ